MPHSDAQKVADRVALVRMRNTERDRDYRKIAAIRRGDYEAVAPGLFNSAEFDKPLIANLIDTTARDIAETMAPLPSVDCEPVTLAKDAEMKRSSLRGAIANAYIQGSRLQDQMYGGADRYGSYGFMVYTAEPDFKAQMPVIRVDDVANAYYTADFRGIVREYFTVKKVYAEDLCHQFPDQRDYLMSSLSQKYGEYKGDMKVEVVRYYDNYCQKLVCLDPCVVLHKVDHLISRCPVRIVPRPQLDPEHTRGQFDDVIWVQIARALVQVYTLNALEQSVNAPIVLPKDVTELSIGPLEAIQTDTPGGVGRVNLALSPGLFPEFATLAQEQRVGSRYPEGRSGNVDASIITGQGMQALMGAFDTQVQTFQRLNASALEDIVGMCFEMDEKVWPDVKKKKRVKESGAAREFEYVPSKAINGNYSCDVSYGAIAGLDPNRGLVFVLQALAGGLMAKSTARKSLPVDLNVQEEERQIQLEQADDSIAAALAQLPLAIPQMAMAGADPRDLVLQVAQYRDLLAKGKSPAEAAVEVFAPKEAEEEAPPSPLEMAQGAGEGPAGLPGAGAGGATDLLMSLAGMSPGGKPNLQSNVSRMRPVQH